MKLSGKFIVILSGPTAVGKTEVALEIAQAFGMEIVNADSLQVYRFLDIGTAKPTEEERRLVPHHLIDVVNPDENFDAGTYQEMADDVIQKLWNRGVVPLVVGGTGLYIRALTRGICQIPDDDHSRKDQIRRELKLRLQEDGLATLYQELRKVDPELAASLHSSDTQRILRGLEVFLLTGKPLSYFQKQHRFASERYHSVKIFLYRDKQELAKRIELRVLEMIERGLCEEVIKILNMGYSPDLKPLQSIGYRQIIEHLEGRMSLDDAIRDIQLETKRYAKRQFTWFRKEPGFQWIDANRRDYLLQILKNSIKKTVFFHQKT
ncbi:MAG: tRNA (adenosine(37)-N6)-dimethylallyltransferase MiaA [Thermodesulforhabdaceae bacterium]